MTKQISLCNQLQTAFVRRCRVPLPETNHDSVSRRWEQCPTSNDRGPPSVIAPRFGIPNFREAILQNSLQPAFFSCQWFVEGISGRKSVETGVVGVQTEAGYAGYSEIRCSLSKDLCNAGTVNSQKRWPADYAAQCNHGGGAQPQAL